jgi:hypothetical protein
VDVCNIHIRGNSHHHQKWEGHRWKQCQSGQQEAHDFVINFLFHKCVTLLLNDPFNFICCYTTSVCRLSGPTENAMHSIHQVNDICHHGPATPSGTRLNEITLVKKLQAIEWCSLQCLFPFVNHGIIQCINKTCN